MIIDSSIAQYLDQVIENRPLLHTLTYFWPTIVFVSIVIVLLRIAKDKDSDRFKTRTDS